MDKGLQEIKHPESPEITKEDTENAKTQGNVETQRKALQDL